MDFKDRPLTFETLINDESFLRYCFNQDKLSVDKWESYVKHNPSKRRLILKTKEEIQLISGQLPESYIEARLEEFKLQFNANHNAPSFNNRIYFNKTIIGLIAACLIFAIGFLLIKPQNTTVQPNFTFKNIQGKVYGPYNAQKTEVNLTDGSKIFVYERSSIIVANDYNRTDRKIVVTGRAYFDVAHQIGKPFKVYSKNLKTTALGTAFFVNDFGETSSSVLLIRGKVNINNSVDTTSNIIHAGKAYILDNVKHKKSIVKFNINAKNEIAFDDLRFKNVETKEVLAKVGLFYGVTFDLAQCDCNLKKITGDYSQQSLSAIISNISFINNLTWESNRTIIRFMEKKK